MRTKIIDKKNTPEYRGITQEQHAGKELHPNKPYI